jgi:hypothetical protein
VSYPVGTAVLLAYVEANGRASVLEPRPAEGGSSVIALAPRPPLTAAELAAADQNGAANVVWVGPTGSGSLDQLWTSDPLPGGAGAAVPEGAVVVDVYSGSFVRVSAGAVDFSDGQAHPFTVELAATAGPGGATIADTAALRALGGAAWYDEGGNLGHVKAAGGADYMTADLADAIDAGSVLVAHQATDAGHPVLQLEAAAFVEHRLTLGELRALMATDPPVAMTVTVRGTHSYASRYEPVDQAPEARAASYVDPADVAAVLGSSPDDPRVFLATIAATHYVATRIADDQVPDDPPAGTDVVVIPVSAAVRSATVAVAVRFYKAPEVPFGLAGTDLTAYVRSVMPEVELLLHGLRADFGIA